jgi:hypothetical protein
VLVSRPFRAAGSRPERAQWPGPGTSRHGARWHERREAAGQRGTRRRTRVAAWQTGGGRASTVPFVCPAPVPRPAPLATSVRGGASARRSGWCDCRAARAISVDLYAGRPVPALGAPGADPGDRRGCWRAGTR